MPSARPHTPSPLAPANHGAGSSDAGPVMVQFQQLMRSIVDTQVQVMLSYLRGSGEAAIEVPVSAPLDAAANRKEIVLPLIDRSELKVADDGGFELVRELDPAVDLYLDDHRLDGQPVFPAAMAMELMAEIAQCCRPDLQVVEIRDFQLFRGVVLEEGPQPIRVIARPQTRAFENAKGTSIHVEIFAGTEDPLPRYRGLVTVAEDFPDPSQIVQARATDLEHFPLSVAEAYESWLFHGRLFEAITAVDGISSQALHAQLVPSRPDECIAQCSGSSWLIDPVVVDGSFQMAILWSRHHNDMTPLPSRFDRYTRFGSLDQPGLRCVLSAECSANGHTLVTRHLFVAGDGTVVGLLEGMESTCSKELNRLARGTVRTGRDA